MCVSVGCDWLLKIKNSGNFSYVCFSLGLGNSASFLPDFGFEILLINLVKISTNKSLCKLFLNSISNIYGFSILKGIKFGFFKMLFQIYSVLKLCYKSLGSFFLFSF